MESFISPYNSPEKAQNGESNLVSVDNEINFISDINEPTLLNQNQDFSDLVGKKDLVAGELLGSGDFINLVEEKNNLHGEKEKSSANLNSNSNLILDNPQDNNKVLLEDNCNAQADIASCSMQENQSNEQISEPLNSSINNNHTTENYTNNPDLHTYESSTAKAYFTATVNEPVDIVDSNHNSDQNVTVSDQNIAQENLQAILQPTTSFNYDHTTVSHLNNSTEIAQVNEQQPECDEVFPPATRGISTDDDTENRPPSSEYLQEIISSTPDVYDCLQGLDLHTSSSVCSCIDSSRNQEILCQPSCRSKDCHLLESSKEKDSVQHVLTINTDLTTFKDLTIKVDFKDKEGKYQENKVLEQSKQVYSSPECNKHDLTVNINLSANTSITSSNDYNLITNNIFDSPRPDLTNTEAELFNKDSIETLVAESVANFVNNIQLSQSNSFIFTSSENSISETENVETKKNSSLLSNVLLMDDDPFLNSELPLCDDYNVNKDKSERGNTPISFKDENFAFETEVVEPIKSLLDENTYGTNSINTSINFVDNQLPSNKILADDNTPLYTEASYANAFNFGCENPIQSECNIDKIAPSSNIAYARTYDDNDGCDYLSNTNFVKSEESLIVQSAIANSLFRERRNFGRDLSLEFNNDIRNPESLKYQSIKCLSSGSDTTIKNSVGQDERLLAEPSSDQNYNSHYSNEFNLNQVQDQNQIDFNKHNGGLYNLWKDDDSNVISKDLEDGFNSYAEIYALNKKSNFCNSLSDTKQENNNTKGNLLHSAESTSTVSTVKTADFSGISDDTGSSDSYSVDFSTLLNTNESDDASSSISGNVSRNLQVELPFYDSSSRSSIDTDYCRYFYNKELSSSQETLTNENQLISNTPPFCKNSYNFEYSDVVGSSLKNLMSTCQSLIKDLDNNKLDLKTNHLPSNLDTLGLNTENSSSLFDENEFMFTGLNNKTCHNNTDIALNKGHLKTSTNQRSKFVDDLTYSTFDSTYSTLPTTSTHFYPIKDQINYGLDEFHASVVENNLNKQCFIDEDPKQIPSDETKNLSTLVKHNDKAWSDSVKDISKVLSDNQISKNVPTKQPKNRLNNEVKNTQSQNLNLQDLKLKSSSALNSNLSNSEMMSISQKMEKEFREMLIQEKKDSKTQQEGSSSATTQPKVETKKQSSQPRKTPLKSKTDQNRTPTPKTNKTPEIKPRRSIVPPRANTTTKKPIPVTTLHLTSPVKTPPPKKTPTKLTATPKRNLPTQRTGSAPLLGTPKRRPCTPTTIQRVTPKSPDASPRPLTSPRVKSDVKTPVVKNYKYQRPLSATSTTSIGSNKSLNSVNSAGTPGRHYKMPEHLKNVKSKTGSLNNINHTPSGGNVKIESKRTSYKSATSKCGSKDNVNHTPGGGNVKIENKKSSFTGVSAKCGSVANIHYKPGGGNVKIESKKLDFSHVSSKCGSKDNIKHTPKGGNVKVESKRINLSHVKSKCGSKDNQHHTPGGGKVKIESKRLNFDNVGSKCGSTDNMKHKPQGGNIKIFSKTRSNFRKVSSKIGSMHNVHHTPGGGKVKVETKKLDFSHVKSKCGSKDNENHTPGGGKVKIESKRLNFDKVGSKCGSTDNMKHKPQGGNVKIFSETPNFNDVGSKIGSKDNIHHTPQGGNTTITSSSLDLSNVRPKVGSRDQIDHTPAGGNVKIQNKKLNLSNVQSKCGSLDNSKHTPGGGDIMIFDEKLAFDQAAQSKVGSLGNAQHTPGGGNVTILNDKLSFRQGANARTDSGINMSSTSSES